MIPIGLDTSAFYYDVTIYSSGMYFNYIRFDSKGNIFGATTRKWMPYDSINKLAKPNNFYVANNQIIRWEVYTDGLNGWLPCHAIIVNDTLKYWYGGSTKGVSLIKLGAK